MKNGIVCRLPKKVSVRLVACFTEAESLDCEWNLYSIPLSGVILMFYWWICVVGYSVCRSTSACVVLRIYVCVFACMQPKRAKRNQQL